MWCPSMDLDGDDRVYLQVVDGDHEGEYQVSAGAFAYITPVKLAGRGNMTVSHKLLCNWKDQSDFLLHADPVEV